MRPDTWLFIFKALMSLALLVGCQSTPPAIDKGFLQEKDLPVAIAERRGDVLKLVVIETFEIPAEQVFERQMKCVGKKTTLPPSCQQIKKCEKDKVCRYETAVSGTGFIDESTGLLITAHHVMTEDEHLTDFAGLISRLNAGNFVIQNNKDQVLFSTREVADRIFSIKDPCSQIRSNTKDHPPFRCDALALQLSRPLLNIRPFQKAPEASKGDISYCLGYPMRTKWQLTSERVNSTGKDLFVTQGKVGDERDLLWENREILMELYPPFKPLYEQYGNRVFSYLLNSRDFTSFFIQDTFVIEGLAYNGMSGGPILNAKGEWTGLTILLMGYKDGLKTKFTYPYSKGVSADFVLTEIKK